MINTTVPFGDKEIRLAMLGKVDGNGHPFSWSAIFNGYDRKAMAEYCSYAPISEYLSKEPPESFGVRGARVTHIWADDPTEALGISRASLIRNVVEHPEDVIGQVDAVIIPTDKGHEHVARCRPFVEAGIPIFVDKPLVDNEADLKTMIGWVNDGAAIMSSSCMRYAREFKPYRRSTEELGALRYCGITTAKSWERYGIHALEAIYPILGPGFVSARNIGTAERNIVHITHQTGVEVVVVAIDDMFGGMCCLQLCGVTGHANAAFADTFYAFRPQILGFMSYLRTGERPFPFAETVELMRLVIAGIRSREEGGREVRLDEILEGYSG
jgi:hypothetical protein